jgi:hypothetical protein
MIRTFLWAPVWALALPLMGLVGVFIKGGVLTSHATGRSTLWRAGRVVWHDGANGVDEGGTNTGATPIEMIWVTLKK